MALKYRLGPYEKIHYKLQIDQGFYILKVLSLIQLLNKNFLFFSKIKNLFIALLLSSFGSDKLKDVKDDEINKIQEAIDRIRSFFKYLTSKLRRKNKTGNKINVRGIF